MNQTMKAKRRMMGLALAVMVVASGCSSNSNGTSTATDGNQSKPGNTASTDENKTADLGYPSNLSYWVGLNPNVAATMKDYGEIAAYRKVEEITGTKVKFQHPPVGQERDQFNLILASGELPDVIEFNWTAAPKGADSLIKEKRILRLNELIDEHAPNLTKVLNDRPEFRKMITTDEGNIYVMPFLLGDPSLSVVNGPIIRKDWLDKVGLDMPKTIADWEQMLIAFRDGDPNGNNQKDEIPFLLSLGEINENHLFVGAWGITTSFYQDNGTVKYGPIQPEFKQFLATMADWYSKGLIDPDYATTDGKLKDAKVTDNRLGAFTGYPGSSIGRYLELVRPGTPAFDLTGPVYPSLEEGGNSIGFFSQPFNGAGTAISATAKNPEQIIKWLDYKYGEEGHLLFNFGIEGESYTMKDGYPTYTDKILKNPDGLPVTQAMAKYFTANWSGPFLQDKRYLEQYYVEEAQRDANRNWSMADHERLLPTLSLTAEESSKSSAILNDATTYRDEMVNRFIMGAESLDNFDKFVDTLKKMGIEEVVATQQAALERYKAR